MCDLVQVKYLLGMKTPRFDTLHETVGALCDNLSTFQWRELLVSSSCRSSVLSHPITSHSIQTYRLSATVST